MVFMANRRVFKISEYRVGAKGAIWKRKTAWNSTKAGVFGSWAKILEKQPGAEELVSVLREAEQAHGANTAKIEAFEKKFAGERAQLNEIKYAIGRCIREGKALGENVGDLRNLSQAVNESVLMTDTVLNELIVFWARKPETKETIAHIRALQGLKKNQKQRREKRKPRPKRGRNR